MYRFIQKAMVCFVLLTSTYASAGLLSVVDFTGSSDRVANEFYYYEGDVSITLSAWTTNVNSSQESLAPWQQLTGPDVGLYRSDIGFGVVSNGQDGADLDGGSSSNLQDLDEGVLISFSEKVDFFGFAASDLSANDDLNLAVVEFVSPGVITMRDIFIDRHASNDGYDIFDVFSGIQGQHFMAWVDGNDDDVRIADMAFAQIPEPDTIYILALGVLLMNWRLSR